MPYSTPLSTAVEITDYRRR